MNWSLLVREGMRSANACDPPNESFFLFNKRSVAVSSRQRGRCQLDMVNKLLIPANLCGRSSPDRNARAGVGVRCSRERTHVQSPNPGSRRARLAGAVHSDDRHMDPGTGEFVTKVLRRFTCHGPALCLGAAAFPSSRPSHKFHIVHPPPLDSAGV